MLKPSLPCSEMIKNALWNWDKGNSALRQDQPGSVSDWYKGSAYGKESLLNTQSTNKSKFMQM